MHQQNRLDYINALRAFGAIPVSWDHIVLANPKIMDGRFTEWALQSSASFGYLGVYVFFLVSGFVIPLSMIRGRYEYRSLGRFLLKRFLRLHPPYLASIGLAVLVGFAATWTPGYAGGAFQIDGMSLLLHLAYLPTVFGKEWLNPVYWTLLIEVEFYIVIALTLPLLLRMSETTVALCLRPAPSAPAIS